MNTCQEAADEISGRAKLALCAAAWGVIIALLVLGEAANQLLAGFTLFGVSTPAGGALAMLFYGGSKNSVLAELPMASGWLYYILLTFFVLRSKRRWVFISLYAILCVNLLLSGFFAKTMMHFQ